MKANKYLCVVEYYILTEKWVPYTTHINPRKKEIEQRLDKIWQKTMEFCFYYVPDKEAYTKMYAEIQKMMKGVCDKNRPICKNIDYYLIPISNDHNIKHIDSNSKEKVEDCLLHEDYTKAWQCIR
tara:strand:- start:305 stop:679 length:375 start_codon:yes stop_codon:yes gene_type:complete